MSVKTYGCNHIAIEVTDIEQAVDLCQKADVVFSDEADQGDGWQ